MEVLSKSARRVLESFRTSTPTFLGGGNYFVIDQMRFPSDIPDSEIRACLNHLEDAKLIKSVSKDCYILTETGLNWPEYFKMEKIDIFLRSVLCPIVVTLITEAALHGLLLLLKLLQAWVQNSPQ